MIQPMAANEKAAPERLLDHAQLDTGGPDPFALIKFQQSMIYSQSILIADIFITSQTRGDTNGIHHRSSGFVRALASS